MTEETTACLNLPAVTFDADGTLRSTRFDDLYFSRAGGAAETGHVFLAGNKLPERWKQKSRITIGELGFGSGLNFLTTWRTFLDTAPKSHRLHFLSFEQFPLTPEMLKRAHGDNPFAKELIAQYPLRLPGFHRVHFPRVTLTLAFGDARALLPQLESGMVDAWFLDGFAPAKNPELWGEDVLREIARTSAPDGTFATYSAASAVRRGLAANGFTVEKVRGFAHKREMLIGKRGGEAKKRERADSVMVIGGGIAGCTVARALAERGLPVTLLERHRVGSGASGNEAGALYPQVTREWRPATAWHFTAYSFMLRQLARWKAEGLAFAQDAPGMVKVAEGEEREKLIGVNTKLGVDPLIAEWLEAGELSEKLGMKLESGGIWFPQGSWVAPAELCRALVQHPNIALREQMHITGLTRVGERWKASLVSGESFGASHVVLATAQQTDKFLPDITMPIGVSAGQVSHLASDAVRERLTRIFCHKGYAIPRGDGYLIGATYDHEDFSGVVTEANHERNLEELERALPSWVKEKHVTGGRTSLRATTPDRLPYVGLVGDGLYVSTGHGSRGLISAPLAAEVIASQVTGEIVPLVKALKKAIDPLRRHQTASASTESNPSLANSAR